MIAGFEVLTEDLAEQIAVTIIPLIDASQRPDLPAL
jgi:hypothetical protein